MSCSWRAGCSGGMLSAVKLWKSSSICGPSATAKPRSPQICDDLFPHLAHRMDGALRFGPRRQGDIDPSRLASRASSRGLEQLAPARGDGSAILSFSALRPAPACLALLRRSCARAPSCARRSSPSCRAPRRARLRGPLHRRRRRCRQAFRVRAFCRRLIGFRSPDTQRPGRGAAPAAPPGPARA